MLRTWFSAVFGRDRQLLADLGVAVAAGDELQHLALALGERAGVGVLGEAAELAEHERGERRGEHRLAGGGPHERVAELVGRRRLEQVAGGAGGDGVEQVALGLADGEDDDRADRRAALDDQRGRRRAACAGRTRRGRGGGRRSRRSRPRRRRPRRPPRTRRRARRGTRRARRRGRRRARTRIIGATLSSTAAPPSRLPVCCAPRPAHRSTPSGRRSTRTDRALRRRRRVEPGSVVADAGEHLPIVVGLGEHHDRGGTGVLERVGDRLADRPGQQVLLVAAQPAAVVDDVDAEPWRGRPLGRATRRRACSTADGCVPRRSSPVDAGTAEQEGPQVEVGLASRAGELGIGGRGAARPGRASAARCRAAPWRPRHAPGGRRSPARFAAAASPASRTPRRTRRRTG